LSTYRARSRFWSNDNVLSVTLVHPVAQILPQLSLQPGPTDHNSTRPKTKETTSIDKMCKFYYTLYACLCENNVKVVKPCTCYAERPTNDLEDRLCDIFQVAKEPIILRDHCSVCARILAMRPLYPVFGQQQGTRHSHLGRYNESRELQHLSTIQAYSRSLGDTEFAVLEPESFDSMFKLMEMLPSLDDLGEAQVTTAETAITEQQGMQSGSGIPMATFTMELADRTRWI